MIFFKIAQKGTIFLATFVSEICCQKLSKISQSAGHTDCRKKSHVQDDSNVIMSTHDDERRDTKGGIFMVVVVASATLTNMISLG